MQTDLADEDLLDYCETLCRQADVCYLASREMMRLGELAGETTLVVAMQRVHCSDPGFIHAYRSRWVLALLEQARKRSQNLMFLETLVEERRRSFLSLAFQNFSCDGLRESYHHFDDAYSKWQEAEKLLDHCRKLPSNWRNGDSVERKPTQENTGDEEPVRLAAE